MQKVGLSIFCFQSITYSLDSQDCCKHMFTSAIKKQTFAFQFLLSNAHWYDHIFADYNSISLDKRSLRYCEAYFHITSQELWSGLLSVYVYL